MTLQDVVAPAKPEKPGFPVDPEPDLERGLGGQPVESEGRDQADDPVRHPLASLGQVVVLSHIGVGQDVHPARRVVEYPLGHQPGEGKHKGRCGALVARLANGNEFRIGTGLSDAERGSPPPIGSVVTFKYQEMTDLGAHVKGEGQID